MYKRARRWAVGLAAVFAVCASGILGAETTRQQQLLQTFQQGVTHYQAGEFQQARQAFDRVLAMKPTMEMALEMRKMAELGTFFQMRDREELGEQADQLIEVMGRAVRQAKRDVQNPHALIEAFHSRKVTEYGRARITLKGHGPYAVPYVAPLLALEGADEQYTAGRAFSLLAELHRDACLPLIQILTNTGKAALKGRVAGVLGQIGDVRAVPALMKVWEAEGTLESTREAAAEAIEAITGQAPGQMTAAESYADLSHAYFQEDAARVGHTYGMKADVWQWNDAGAPLPDRVIYERVPNYLYYSRMAGEVAWSGLSAAPASRELQALFAASLARQLALCRYFESADYRFGGEKVTEQERQEAAQRAEKLGAEVPVALALLDTPSLGRALQLALDADYGPTALFLVKRLRTKVALEGLEGPDAVAAQTLPAALDCGYKDVRYNAAIALVEGSPSGAATPADHTMEVLRAALRAVTAKRALVLVDDFMMRNKLSDILQGGGLATLQAPVNEASIESALHLEPSVDVVLLSNDVPELLMQTVMAKLTQDPRTKGLPLYVVAAPSGEGADVSGYEKVTRVLAADDIRADALKPIIANVLAKSRSPFTREEEALVLDAAGALNGVDPGNTAYPLGVLEPALIDALEGYSDEVTAAAVNALAAFGSEQALAPLSGIVERGSTDQLKISACQAMAAVLERTQAVLPKEAYRVLRKAHGTGSQALQEAAAEAIGSSELSDGEVLGLVRKEPLGLK